MVTASEISERSGRARINSSPPWRASVFDLPNRRLEPLTGSFETGIAQLMSQVVVDLLEAIQINATDSNQVALRGR